MVDFNHFLLYNIMCKGDGEYGKQKTKINYRRRCDWEW